MSGHLSLDASLALVPPPNGPPEDRDAAALTVQVSPGPATTGPPVTGPSVTMTVTGDLDGVGGPVLQSAWDDGLDAVQGHVHLDLLGVAYCNAAGLRVLAQIIATCRERGWELELSATGMLSWLIHLVGLDSDPGSRPGTRPVPGRASSSTVVPRPRTTEPVGPAVVGQVSVRPRVHDVAGAATWVRAVARAELPEVVDAIVRAAGHTIAGVESVNLVLSTGRRDSDSVGGAGLLGDRLAVAEERLRQGPGWRSQREAVDVFVEDLWDRGSLRTWPRLVPAVSALPVRSLMSLHLSVPGRALGTLTLSSAHPQAFDQDACAAAQVLAASASVVLAGERERRHLTEALVHRDVIGQAKGILMARHRLTADQAFDVLRTASVQSNTKLHRIAEQVTLTGDV